MVLLLAISCVHRSTWTETPPPVVALPKTQVAVIAEDKACRDIADELAEALESRTAFDVQPEAPVRIVVRDCTSSLRADVDVSLVYGDPSVTQERRDVAIVGMATAEVRIDVPEAEPALLKETVRRTSSGAPAIDQGSDGIPRAFTVQNQMQRDLALAFAQEIAPLPETIRRRMYRDPEPGTAESLHNQAVELERRGDLRAALDLARQAYGADPTAQHMSYVETLKLRSEETGYAQGPAPGATGASGNREAR